MLKIKKEEIRIDEHDLDNMIIYNLGISIFEMEDQQEFFPSLTREKREMKVCEKCMKYEEYYFTEKGEIACKHNMKDLLKEFKEMMKKDFN
ncbi:hypothetical protein ES708_29867 [subsurface metagenome]